MTDGLDPLQRNDSGAPESVVAQQISVTFKVPIGPGVRFADGAFDSMIGCELPIGLPGGNAAGTLTGASVVDDGAALLLAFEVGGDVARILSVVDARDYSIGFTGGELTFKPIPARDAATVGDLDEPDRVECRVMPTRRCPGSGCAAGPCARFESDSEEPWLPVVDRG